MEKFQFPNGFLWGSATSAHQVEGNNKNSDWWRWENSPQRLEELKKQNKNPEDYLSGIACDSYNRYEEDFDIAKSLNQNAHRLSIEWSRIEPRMGEFDQAEIEHYRKVLQALKNRGIKTFVTLHHYTNPVWFFDMGGWEKRENNKYFIEYARKLLSQLGDLMDFVCIFNEINIYASDSYLRRNWPPQKKNYFLTAKVMANMVAAHRDLYKILKAGERKYILGSASAAAYVQTRGVLKVFQSIFRKRAFLDLVGQLAQYSDFIGINYYRRVGYKLSWKFPFFRAYSENGERNDFGWDIYAPGVRAVLNECRKFAKPIYITENGTADAEDRQRTRFISEHLQQVQLAIQDGCDVRGYLHWSLLDNFEWASGYTMKFGLVEIDRKNNLGRKIRNSAKFYAEICKNNYLQI